MVLFYSNQALNKELFRIVAPVVAILKISTLQVIYLFQWRILKLFNMLLPFIFYVCYLDWQVFCITA